MKKGNYINSRSSRWKTTCFILECIQKVVPSTPHLKTWSFNQNLDIFRFLAKRRQELSIISNFQ